jgi:hypothetical protein
MRQLIRKRNERGNGGEHRSEKQCFLKQIKVVVYYLKMGLIISMVEFISALGVFRTTYYRLGKHVTYASFKT